MSPDERYLRLKSEFLAMARKYSRSESSMVDELLSVANLAMVRVLVDHRTSKFDLDERIRWRVKNDMLTFIRAEYRYRIRVRSRPLEAFSEVEMPQGLPDVLGGLGSDAIYAAHVLISETSGDPRFIMDRSLDTLYRLLGWRRTHNAIDELRTAFGG